MTETSGERSPATERRQSLDRVGRSGYITTPPAVRLKSEPVPPEVCPSCGFTGRQANEYRGGVLWRTCHDQWHHGHIGSPAGEVPDGR